MLEFASESPVWTFLYLLVICWTFFCCVLVVSQALSGRKARKKDDGNGRDD